MSYPSLIPFKILNEVTMELTIKAFLTIVFIVLANLVSLTTIVNSSACLCLPRYNQMLGILSIPISLNLRWCLRNYLSLAPAINPISNHYSFTRWEEEGGGKGSSSWLEHIINVPFKSIMLRCTDEDGMRWNKIEGRWKTFTSCKRAAERKKKKQQLLINFGAQQSQVIHFVLWSRPLVSSNKFKLFFEKIMNGSSNFSFFFFLFSW